MTNEEDARDVLLLELVKHGISVASCDYINWLISRLVAMEKANQALTVIYRDLQGAMVWIDYKMNERKHQRLLQQRSKKRKRRRK